MQNNFFGSKLNSVLLIALIILMIVAIKIMLKNKETYFPYLTKDKTEQVPSSYSRILGNKNDLVSFSILPGSKVHGVISYKGSIKGAYFFEANILVGVTDVNKKIILQSHAMATTDWMTVGPVSFEGKLDFSKLPKGPSFIEIHNDNASGLSKNDKSVFIPIIIE